MAVEPETVRHRAGPQGEALQEDAWETEVAEREAGEREDGEANARDLVKQLELMHASLEGAKLEAQSSCSIAEESLKELMDVTERLAEAEEITNSATAAATSYRLQYEILARELEQRNSELAYWRTCAESLKQELAELQDDMKQKAPTQQEYNRSESEDLASQIEMALRRTYSHKECELQKLLNDVSTQNIKHLEMQLVAKDEKMGRLRQELEKQQTRDQELQKKNITLEFCLGEAQREIRILKEILEDQESRSLCSQIWQQEAKSAAGSKPGFWDNLKLPGILSASAIAVACILKH